MESAPHRSRCLLIISVRFVLNRFRRQWGPSWREEITHPTDSRMEEFVPFYIFIVFLATTSEKRNIYLLAFVSFGKRNDVKEREREPKRKRWPIACVCALSRISLADCRLPKGAPVHYVTPVAPHANSISGCRLGTFIFPQVGPFYRSHFSTRVEIIEKIRNPVIPLIRLRERERELVLN